MRMTQRAQVIIDLIQENDYKNILEVGVCKGETAIPVIEACELYSYVMIDPAINDVFGLRAFVEEHPRAVLGEMTSLEASKIFPDNYFDLAFIDTLHDEDTVDGDVHVWTPKVRKDGIICVHDYDNRRFPGVKIAVDRFYGVENVETRPVRACQMAIIRR